MLKFRWAFVALITLSTLVLAGCGGPTAPSAVMVTPPVANTAPTGPITTQVAAVPVGFRIDPGGPGFNINLPSTPDGKLTTRQLMVLGA